MATPAQEVDKHRFEKASNAVSEGRPGKETSPAFIKTPCFFESIKLSFREKNLAVLWEWQTAALDKNKRHGPTASRAKATGSSVPVSESQESLALGLA